MKLNENLTDSFNYTKLLFNDLGKLVILAILDVIPIVNFMVLGYLVNVMKQSKDQNQLPALENYGDLFVQGLKMLIAIVVLMIIPLVLAAPALIMLIVSQMGISEWIGPLFELVVVLPLFYIGLALAFFIGCITAMGIVNMAKNDNNISKMFAFNEILAIIGKIGWGSYIIWLAVLFIGSIVVSAVLGNIPIIGWLLGLLVSPIIGIFMARSASLVYMEAKPEPTPAAPTEQA